MIAAVIDVHQRRPRVLWLIVASYREKRAKSDDTMENNKQDNVGAGGTMVASLLKSEFQLPRLKHVGLRCRGAALAPWHFW